MHYSLRPRTKVIGSVVAALLLLTAVLIAPIFPWRFLGLGAALGVVAGIFQVWAVRDASSALLVAQSRAEIVRALRGSRVGKIYTVVVLTCILTIVVLGLGLEDITGGAVGYTTYSSVLNLFSLRATLELSRLSGGLSPAAAPQHPPGS